MGLVGSKTRSQGQICLKPCVHPDATLSNFMKLHQNICLDDMFVKFKCGSCGVKN